MDLLPFFIIEIRRRMSSNIRIKLYHPETHICVWPDSSSRTFYMITLASFPQDVPAFEIRHFQSAALHGAGENLFATPTDDFVIDGCVSSTYCIAYDKFI